MIKYAYYPGCSALKSATEVDLSTRIVMNRFGMDWKILAEAACCGSRESGGLEVEDEFLSLVMNARTLAMAEAIDAGVIVTVCSTCQLNLERDNKLLKADSELLKRVNGILGEKGYKYGGTVKVQHLLYIILDYLGLNVLKDTIKRPLTGMKIAPFYGCHLLRPAAIHDFREDPYDPHALGVIIEALGAKEIKYAGSANCCGFHSLLLEEDHVLKMSGRWLLNAMEQGADFLITPCPLCHTVLDGYQTRIEKAVQQKLGIPILHLSQLIGISQGFTRDELALNRHMVKVDRIIH